MRSEIVAPSVLLLVSALCACGGPPALYGGEGAGHAAPGKDNGPTMVPYPGGPYGADIGDTLMNISRPGYRLSATQVDWASLTWDQAIAIGELRATKQYRCLFVNFSASWCGACEDEQGTLNKRVSADPAFGVYEILDEGPDPDKHGNFPVTRSHVDAWTQQFKQHFPVVLGDPTTHALLEGYLMGENAFPFNLVVQPSTMKIVDGFFGDATDELLDGAAAKCAASP